MGTSRLGGVPTVLPPPDSLPPPGQLGLDLDGRRRRSRCHHEVLPDVVHVAGWLDLDRPASARRRLPPLGRAAGRAAPPPRAGRTPDDGAVGVPRLALAAVRLQPHRRRHRRRAGEAAARPNVDRARPAGRRRHVRTPTRATATRPTRRSSTSTRPAPDSACTRTARSRRTRRSSRSASATPACSASPASTAGPARSSTSSCAAATCSCSAAPTAASTTASRRCSTAPGRRASACRPVGLSITVRETGL